MERKRLYPTLKEYEEYKKQLRALRIDQCDLSSDHELGNKTIRRKGKPDINELATSIVKRTIALVE
jgi:hypothetical protein